MSLESHSQATEEERYLAAETICEWIDYNKNTREKSIRLLKILDSIFPGITPFYINVTTGSNPSYAKIADSKVPKLLVDILQLDFLAVPEIRTMLLESMSKKDPFNPLFFRTQKDTTNQYDSHQETYSVSDLVSRRRSPGGNWSRKFAKEFGFPHIFTGISSKPVNLPYEDVEAPFPLPPLEDFQENLRLQLLNLLREAIGTKNRGILRLPTGSGKTRVMVEAAIDFWRENENTNRFMLWISQTEELCEQAFQSFRQVWLSKGNPGQKLRIYRFWGANRHFPPIDESGIIISGISKLYEECNNNEGFRLSEIQSMLLAVIIDESHRSITSMYNSVLKYLNIEIKPSDAKQTPLIRLTATPYRGFNSYETEQLRRRYNNNILYVKGANFRNWTDWNTVKEELTKRGILSHLNRTVIETHIDFHLTRDELDFFDSKGILNKHLLSRIGNFHKRNRTIFNKLVEIARIKKSILFFAPSVINANIISCLLQDSNFGIRSAVVSGETASGLRQSYIEKFKEQKIQVLCNYGVLTTGFDAPLIDAILIARPTESPNLYEQMIGQGLRGPKFGGTDECIIMDLIDNIYLIHNKKFTDGSTNYWNSNQENSSIVDDTK